jgi:hypothetical protein
MRVGKKFNSVMWKPKVTLWYDYLSGTSDKDASDGEYNSFNTLFDTGHKFYGFMDLFLNSQQTANLGLVDYAVKLSIQPSAKWTLKADFHLFETAEGINSNPLMAQAGGGTLSPGNDEGHDLGTEIDLTAVHKYNSNMTISMGYSYFDNDAGLDLVKFNSGASDPDSGQWGYLQVDVKF